MQHGKNGEARNVGKHNMGAHKRRSGAEHFERHAAWERISSQKTWKSLSNFMFFSGGAGRRGMRVRTQKGAEVTPSTSAANRTRRAKGQPQATPETQKGTRRILENKAPERQQGKTKFREMERAATEYRKTKRESAKDAT